MPKHSGVWMFKGSYLRCILASRARASAVIYPRTSSVIKVRSMSRTTGASTEGITISPAHIAAPPCSSKRSVQAVCGTPTPSIIYLLNPGVESRGRTHVPSSAQPASLPPPLPSPLREMKRLRYSKGRVSLFWQGRPVSSAFDTAKQGTAMCRVQKIPLTTNNLVAHFTFISFATSRVRDGPEHHTPHHPWSGVPGHGGEGVNRSCNHARIPTRSVKHLHSYNISEIPACHHTT